MTLPVFLSHLALTQRIKSLYDVAQSIPLWALIAGFIFLLNAAILSLYVLVLVSAPRPREPAAFEKKYRAILKEHFGSALFDLPCWYDAWKREKASMARNAKAKRNSLSGRNEPQPEAPEVLVSVVVPAYNEEKRLSAMLEEAVAHLEATYGPGAPASQKDAKLRKRQTANGKSEKEELTGWEILVISDGSTDKTVETALRFALEHGVVDASIRVVELEANRGKGGAVTHGMRHVRGKYVIFADADGATRFSDLGKMIARAREVGEKDPLDLGRAVIVGSRSHLVGSEAVVKRSRLRNGLMYAFHMFIRLLTTPKTSKIGDTQCGFKLFTRSSLPFVIPYMHSEGWIFDVEMLMLTEMAGIQMEEVQVGWHEITGSKLNVIWDSLGMAWGLFVVRAAWLLGIWKKT